jgi:hypothetical protein
MGNNVFIIQRKFFDELKGINFNGKWVGVSNKMMQLLHYYVIEEEDGSATFLKNRATGIPSHTKAEYEEFRKKYLSY